MSTFEHNEVKKLPSSPAQHRSPSPAGDRGPDQGRGISPATLLHLQRLAGNSAVAQLLAEQEEGSPVLQVVGRQGGRPLEPDVRTDMETRLGAEFSDVRIHTGPQAAASAAAVEARAYTVGNEIVFGPGSYAPGTSDGKHTLAHELTHVVQQRSGPVSGTDTGTGIAVSDPADVFEQEAETNASRAIEG